MSSLMAHGQNDKDGMCVQVNAMLLFMITDTSLFENHVSRGADTSSYNSIEIQDLLDHDSMLVETFAHSLYVS